MGMRIMSQSRMGTSAGLPRRTMRLILPVLPRLSYSEWSLMSLLERIVLTVAAILTVAWVTLLIWVVVSMITYAD
jgi:hypothetical protein